MQELAAAFIEPRNATHRQYEALRAEWHLLKPCLGRCLSFVFGVIRTAS